MRLAAVLPSLLICFSISDVAIAAADTCLQGQTVLPEASTAEQQTRVLSYVINASLDPDGRTIRAQLQVTWRNTTSAPTQELLWHVYNNAWADRDSLWLVEARRFCDMSEPAVWGGTEVSNVRLSGLQTAAGQGSGSMPQALPLLWEYLAQPGAPSDRTVARVFLPQQIAPGESVSVSLDFTATMPRSYHASGWGSGGFIHAAQWFPKLGVFEQQSGQARWNCPPYHYLAEFYADFADFEVNLTLPAKYRDKLVATGTLIDGDPSTNPDGTITYRTLASAVHDYGWTADPDALLLSREFRAEDFHDEAEEQRVAAALNQTVESLLPTPTRMILMLQPEHLGLAERYFDSLGKALYYYGLWYGSYPYETISCVDPANDARQIGHMEFPRLIVGAVRLGHADTTLSQEILTVHEFGHQFWGGMVANDEVQHAWLDEGFSSFSTQRLIQHAYPPQLETYSVFRQEFVGRSPFTRAGSTTGGLRARLGLPANANPGIGNVPTLALRLAPRDTLLDFMAELPAVTYFPNVERNLVLEERRRLATAWGKPMSHPTMELDSREQVRINAYSRPAMTLETMARLVGEERWTQVMRSYHQRFRFQHPGPMDFISVVQEVASDTTLQGVNGSVTISWATFWQAAYFGNEELDFKVEEFHNDLSAKGDGSFDVSLRISRRSDFFVPVEVDVEWEDGSVSRLVWSGADWQWSYVFEGSPQPAVRVDIDPERRLVLDRDWLNNSVQLNTDNELSLAYAMQLMLWTQQFLQFHGGGG